MRSFSYLTFILLLMMNFYKKVVYKYTKKKSIYERKALICVEVLMYFVVKTIQFD